jgi:hypothetical protein
MMYNLLAHRRRNKMDSLFIQFGGLLGFAALVSMVIDAFKRLGWVQDGTSQNWSLGMNLGGFILFVILRLWKPDYIALDSTLSVVAGIGASIIALIAQLVASKVTHIVLTDTPLAKSF